MNHENKMHWWSLNDPETKIIIVVINYITWRPLVVGWRSNPENSKVGKFEFRDLSQTQTCGERSPVPNLSCSMFDLRQKSLNLFLSPALICTPGDGSPGSPQRGALWSLILMVWNRTISDSTHLKNFNKAGLLLWWHEEPGHANRMPCLLKFCLKHLWLNHTRIYIDVPHTHSLSYPTYIISICFRKSHHFCNSGQESQLHIHISGIRSRGMDGWTSQWMTPAFGFTENSNLTVHSVLKSRHGQNVFSSQNTLYQKILCSKWHQTIIKMSLMLELQGSFKMIYQSTVSQNK